MLLTLRLAFAASILAAGALLPAAARAADYVPNEVVVGYSAGPTAAVTENISRQTGISTSPVTPSPAPGAQVVRLPRGVGVGQALKRLRHQPGVAYAVPNFLAHAAGSWIPDDPGRGKVAQGWQRLQWNFLPSTGVNAPAAWANLRADHRPGGSGVTVAILDTGVAYRNWRQFKQSPDFVGTRFVRPYDFVRHNAFPLDREGHGTFVAGTVAESTNNGFGLTGLAYGASIMPVRILDAGGPSPGGFATPRPTARR
jgi:serine protease